jgi:hypothetical protein
MLVDEKKDARERVSSSSFSHQESKEEAEMEGRARQRSKNRAASVEPVSSVSTRRSANGVANNARRKAAAYEMGMDNSNPEALAAIDILATSLIGKPRMPQTTAHAVFARPRKGRSSRDNPAKPRIITYETLLPLFRLKLPEACKKLVSFCDHGTIDFLVFLWLRRCSLRNVCS